MTITGSSAGLDAALGALEGAWQRHLDALVELARIPGVSAEAPPSAAVADSARAVARLAEAAGLEHVEVVEMPGGHPYVLADWLHAEGAPTLLLYAHHDVQPPGRPERWLTPAFEPTMRADGRLYGRGVVDDKAGVLMHLAACTSWLEATGALPVNVKLVIEGEEEVGSTTLEAFLAAHRERLAADVLVLTDTANLDAGVPSLTYALRGLVGVAVEVRALDHPIHSGMWGGPVPDPVMALAKALAALTDERGRLALDVWGDVRALTGEERRALAALPVTEAAFREQCGLVSGAELVGTPDTPLFGRVWREPAVTVIALEARPIVGSTNQIIESARARVSVRIVPDQDPVTVQRALVRHFETAVPWGLEVTVTPETAAGWWITDPTGPAFEAARRALERAYGHDLALIGCGGSIPFVEPFANVLGGVPALLLGLEDPICNAHGENESLNVDDWKKGTRAAVLLYDELARANPRRT